MQKSPFLRLLSVTSLVLVMGLITLQLLRWLGSEQQYLPAPHPWMTRTPWLVARMTPEDCSQMALEQLLEIDQRWLIWIDIQPNHAQEFEVVCPDSHIFEVRSAAKIGPRLERILPMLKNRGVIFNIRAVDISVTRPFLQLIEHWSEKKVDIGIASSSQALLRDLRKARPDWLFAADASAWTKLKFFATFGIEAAVELWPDFFIASLDKDEPNFFGAIAAKEITHRKKVLLLEMNDDDKIDPSWKESVQGVLTNRPKTFSPDTFFKKTGAE